MQAIALLTCVAGFAMVAHAQAGTYTWQVSLDNGSTWTSSTTAPAWSPIKVRLLASWSGINGSSIGYAGGQFDGTLSGATPLDAVSNIRPLHEGPIPQLLAATPYAVGIKLDVAADTFAPGIGNGWINPGQPAADFGPPGSYNSQNPVAILTFDIMWAGSTIDFGMVINSTPNRAMAIYTSPDRTQVRLSSTQVTINTARLTVPAIGAFPLIAAAGSVTIFRRRR